MNEDTTRQLPQDALKIILERFDRVEARFDSVESRLASLERRQENLERRQENLERRQENLEHRQENFEQRQENFERTVETRLAALERQQEMMEQKVDARLVETRPIWEKALAEISGLRLEVADFRRETNQNLHKLDRRIETLSRDVLDVRGDMRMLEDRLAAFEPKAR